jgi:hypothetical protein
VESSESAPGDALIDGSSAEPHEVADAGPETAADASGGIEVSNDAGADGGVDAPSDEAPVGEDAGPDGRAGETAEDAGDAAEETGDAAEDAGDALGEAGDAFGEAGDGAGEVQRIGDGTWADWESLGGDIVGRPAVVASGGNQLDIVVRQTDDAVYHKRFLSAWLPSKTTFSFLGGPMKGDPDVGLNVNGDVDVVARGIGDHLYYKVRNAQFGSWSPSLTGWSDMGGIAMDAPHIGERSTGERDVVVIGTDLIASRKERDAATGEWWPSQGGDWSALGGPSVVTPTILDIGGKIYLTAMSPDGEGLMKHGPATWQPSETTWEDIGGPISGAPAMTSWQAGRLDVVARLPDGSVGFKTWTGSWQPSQMDWLSLGGSVIGRPSIVAWGAGRLDLIARAANGKVVYKSWTNEAGWWPSMNEWANLGDRNGGDPIVVSWAPRRLDVFVRGDDGALWHRARLY